MIITNFLSESCEKLLKNLWEYSDYDMETDNSTLFTSTYSGLVPLVDVFLNLNSTTGTIVENSLVIPYHHFKFIGRYSTQSFSTFNEYLSSHNLRIIRTEYTLNGETATFYVAPGIVFISTREGVKILFMICLSHNVFKSLFSGLTLEFLTPEDIKVYMDSSLLKSKYSRMYKILNSLYIEPLAQNEVEICIKPSEVFMKEVLGNENDEKIISQEDFERFNAILREEIL